MERLSTEIPLDCELVALGDTHIGSALCNRSGIRRVIDYIGAEPARYWLHMGDWIEAIATDDPRYDVQSTEQPIPLIQARDAIEMFRPIAGRCIVGLAGNHELKLHRFGNLAEFICRELGITYGTYASRVRFYHGTKTLFRAFLWHGPTRGAISSNAKDYEQRQANMRAALKMKMKYKMGDCAIMLMGHVHKLIVVPPSRQLYLRDGADGMVGDYLAGQQTGKWIDPDLRWYGCTGAFLKLYQDGISGYAEIGGYDPVELGCLLIRIAGGRIASIEPMVI